MPAAQARLPRRALLLALRASNGGETLELGQFAAGDNAAEAFDHLSVVLEFAAFDVNPADPVAAGEDRAAGVESMGGKGFVVRERTHGVVGGEAFAPGLRFIRGGGGQSDRSTI